jgi:hypothetical protein
MNARPGGDNDVSQELTAYRLVSAPSARRAPIFEGANVRNGAAVAVPVDSRAAPVEVLGVTKLDAAIDRAARSA